MPVLPRKLLQTDLNASHALSSFKLRRSSKSVSFSTSRIWGPTKMPSLSLAALRPGNTVNKCWKAAQFFCNALTKFFIKPSLMWRGGRSTLFMSTRGFSLRLCSPGTKVLLDPPPVFLLVMLGYSSTITGTEKTIALSEARLHTHKKTNDLICSDTWNWWYLHLPGLGSTV